MNDEAQRNTWFMILLFKTKTHIHTHTKTKLRNKIKESGYLSLFLRKGGIKFFEVLAIPIS